MIALHDFFGEARKWARGRWWSPRAVLLAYLVWCDWRLLRDPESWTIFGGVTLGVHEMGHLATAFLPHIVCAAGGSAFQLLIPILVIVIYLRQGDYFAMSVGGFWLSFSAFDLARYVGDARSMELPLVGFSSDPEHDWNYILDALHMLPADHFLAFLIRVFATLTGAASLAFAVWLLNEMRKPKPLPAARVFSSAKPLTRKRAGTTTSQAAQEWDNLTKPR